MDCFLWLAGKFLPRVKYFNYLRVLFISETTLEREFGWKIGAAWVVYPKGKALDLPVSRCSYPAVTEADVGFLRMDYMDMSQLRRYSVW